MLNVQIPQRVVDALATLGYAVAQDLGYGRALAKVRLADLQTRPEFAQLRAVEPDDKQLETLSMSVATKGVFFPPMIFLDTASANPSLFVVDGNQRLRAMVKAKIDELFVIVGPWATVDEALRDGLSAQHARFPVGENDLFPLIARGTFSAEELAKLTGISVTKIRQMKSIADHPEAVSLITQKRVTVGAMAKVITACKELPERLTLVKNSLVVRRDAYDRRADAIAKKMRENRGQKFDAATKRKADKMNTFAGEDWNAWVEALGIGGDVPPLTKIEDGVEVLDVVAEAKVVPRVGDSEEWNDRVALFNLAGQRYTDLDRDAFGEVIANWSSIGDMLKTMFDRLSDAEGRKAAEERFPMPSSNPTVEDVPTEPPTDQSADDWEVDGQQEQPEDFKI